MADIPENPERTHKIDPELVAEFDRLYAKLHELIKRTQNDKDAGETVRMTITLPKEWAILAAWLEIRRWMWHAGDGSPIRNEINLDTRRGHWQDARDYVWWALNEHFHQELHELATHRHYLLHRPPPRPEKPPEGPHVPGVPREYSKVGITTPEKAAEYSSDICGIVAVQRAHDSAEQAEREGRTGEAEFYRATLAILLEWYDKPAESVTGDEDLPEFPDGNP